TTLFAMAIGLVTPVTLVFCRFFGFRPSIGQLIAIVLPSILVLYLMQYMRHVFDGITTKLFFRGYYDPQDVLDKLSDILVRTSDEATLRAETAQVLRVALKPSMFEYALFADGSGTRLAKQIQRYSSMEATNIIDADVKEGDRRLLNVMREGGVSLAVKLRTTHEDLGYMILGYKQSGEVYTERDRRLLGVAADEIAISLQNALRFQEIQRFNVTLQQRINDATRKLRRTNQRLRELDETKDDFISMASHQLRTPLTSVKGYLSLVLEGDAGKLNETQTKMLRQAFSSSQRMVFLITDLLNISRLKTGKFVIDATPVD